VQSAFYYLVVEDAGTEIGRAVVPAGKTVAAGLFVLLSLSLIGVPPLPGFWAKLLVIMPLLTLDQPLYYFAVFIILAAASLEANYLFRVVMKLYDKQPTAVPHKAHATADLATAVFLGGGLIAAVFMLVPLADRLDSIAAQATDVSTYIQTVAPQSLEGDVQ
jgi:NADH:ubiquinone oxidoreductase subunit 2 (subunit N)